MNLFAWLLVGHLVGDFLLQTRWMAEGKTARWWPLLAHSTVYTGAVALLALPAGGLSWRGLALVFLAHLVLDRRRFVQFWVRRVTGAAGVPWLVIMTDQSWHIVVLAAATLL
jgi:hypothetical protein